MTLEKISPDGRRISRGTFNALIDHAQAHTWPNNAPQPWASPAPYAQSPVVVTVKNTGANDIPCFGWIELTGTPTPHSESGSHGDGAGTAFDRWTPRVTGRRPTSALGLTTRPQAYAVAQEPIAAGNSGAAILRGLTWALMHQVNSGTTDGRYLNPIGAKLVSEARARRASTGPAQMLFCAADSAAADTGELAYVILDSLGTSKPSRCVLVSDPVDFYTRRTSGTTAGGTIPQYSQKLWVYPRLYGQISNDSGQIFESLHTLSGTTTGGGPFANIHGYTRCKLSMSTVWKLATFSEYEAESLLGKHLEHLHQYTDVDQFGASNTRNTQNAQSGQYARKLYDPFALVATETEFSDDNGATWSPAQPLGRSTLTRFFFSAAFGTAYLYACHSGFAFFERRSTSDPYPRQLRACCYRTNDSVLKDDAELHEWHVTLEQISDE